MPFIYFADVSGLSQTWNKLRRRCASFKAVSGPTSLDTESSYILTDPVAPYAVLPSDRHQRAASVTPIIEHSPTKGLQRPFPWRKSHSVEKYEYRDINLNSSIPDKINKTIPLPEDYWKVHEQDVKVWRIGCVTPNRPVSLRDLPKDAANWEFSVQNYENMSADRAPNRIRYYTGDVETESKRKHSLDATDRKELKFPGLKAFKSASMRLPGQKSSIQEVQQMLRNKLNRLNVGLRKKRTLSVQEVFQQPPSSQNTPVRSKPQFYVPSPMANGKIYADDNNEPSSLPPMINNAKSNNDGSVSPCKSLSPTKSNDLNKQITRTQSYRTKIHVPGASEPTAATDSPAKSANGTDQNAKSNGRMPQFLIGGRVSLRDKTTPKSTTSTASKISNAVRERMRRRPRSHSPAKPKSTLANGTQKNRDSGGFFDRINRMMHVNHLPPSHGSANNNCNRNKAAGDSIGSHESNGTSPGVPAMVTKKVLNNIEANGSHDDPANINNNNNNSMKSVETPKSNSDLDAPQKPEALFIRDRRMASKQVRRRRFLLLLSRIFRYFFSSVECGQRR